MSNVKKYIITIVMMLFVAIFFSCNSVTNGEHGEDEHGNAGGEESGIQYALGDICNEVYNGVHLNLFYEASNHSFTGTVENTTGMTLKKVRVEVHLSNEIELGPTTPIDLGSGEIQSVKLDAINQNFEKWSAHPEVGSSEHGEHDGEGSGEHGESHE